MVQPAGWMQKLTGRDAMRSPGAPSHRNEIERRFWMKVATGVMSEEAAETIGVSPAVGTRWFRHRGGMPLFMAKPVSGRYLSFAEREEIRLLRAQDVSVREIARRTGRSPSTVSRELTRNAATRGGQLEYRASVAQWKAEMVAKRPKPAKLVIHPQLRHYVQDRLEGRIRDTAGREMAGPRPAPFKGRNTPHRGDRKWVTGWSPEQIALRLQIDFPNDESMRISHEAIYQALYIQGRGALKRELVSCLRTGRAGVARATGQSTGQGVGARQRGGHDLQPSCRGARPRRAWALGGGPDHRPEPVCDRDAGGAIKPLHHAGSPASREGLWADPPHEERPHAGWLRSHHHGQCAQENGDNPTCPAVAIIDLGSWQRTIRSRPVHRRGRGEGLLC